MKTALQTALQEMIQALNDEIKDVKKQLGNKFYVYDGKLIASDSEGYLYSFFIDSETFIMEESRVVLKAGRLKTEASVISSEGHTVLLKLDESIGRKIVEAQITIDASFLLQQLADNLSSLARGEAADYGRIEPLLGLAKPGAIVPKGIQGLLYTLGDRINRNIEFNSFQKRAIGKILGSDQLFVWGPPGTGKTQTLAFSVAALLEWGDSILLTAHSNAALDVAISKVVEYLQGTEWLQQGQVVRLGTPRRLTPSVANLVSVEALLSRKPGAAGILKKIRQLRDRASQIRVELSDASLGEKTRNQKAEQLSKIHSEIKAARMELKQFEHELILKSRLLCCTLSKLALEPSFKEKRFTTLVADEVSMALVPSLALASTFVDEKVFLFGDFKQLPPIAISKTPASKKWLQKDIFEKAGVSQQVKTDDVDGRLALLAEQYRMHPEISRICNLIAYNGKLRDGDGEAVLQRIKRITSKHPFPEQPLLYLDTTDLNMHCYRDKLSSSRYNPLSAALAFKAAQQFFADGHTNIGIITPYSAQARVLRSLLMDAGLIETVKVSTVHKFQGDECEVIIFDLVDGPPIPEVGKLLQGGPDSQAMRLLNVAISRAIGKLLLIANFSYFDIRLKRRETLRTVLKHFKEHAHQVNSEWLRKVIGKPDGNVEFFKGAALQRELERALLSARVEAAFVINDDFSFFRNYLAILKEIGNRGCSVLLGGLKKHVDHFVGHINNLKKWDRKPLREQIIFLDKKELWLVFREEQKFSAVRFKGERMGKVVPALLEAVPKDARKTIITPEGKLSEAPFGKCPVCRNQLWPEARSWGIAMACSSNGCSYFRKAYTNELTAYMRIVGYMCDACGGQLRVVSGIGKTPFVGCANYPKCKGFKPRSIWEYIG